MHGLAGLSPEAQVAPGGFGQEDILHYQVLQARQRVAALPSVDLKRY